MKNCNGFKIGGVIGIVVAVATLMLLTHEYGILIWGATAIIAGFVCGVQSERCDCRETEFWRKQNALGNKP